jgi:hypothetical protein
MERTFLVCYIADGWKWRSEKEMPQKTKITLSGGEKAKEDIFYSKIKHTSCAHPIILSWSLIEE